MRTKLREWGSSPRLARASFCVLPHGRATASTAHRSRPPPTAHRPLLTAHCSPLTAHRPLLTAHCSPLSAHRSLLTAHCSPLTAHRSLPTAHCPLPTAHCPLLTDFSDSGTCSPVSLLSRDAHRSCVRS